MNYMEHYIINPNFLTSLGFDFVFYLIQSIQRDDTENKLLKLDIETYSVLGSNDFLCKYYEKKGSYAFHNLLMQNDISFKSINPWRVKNIDRYYFSNNLEFTPWNVKGNSILMNLDKIQKSHLNISQQDKDELIGNNYVFEVPMKTDRLLEYKDYHAFIFASFKSLGNQSYDEQLSYLRKETKEILLPEFTDVIFGIYWGFDHTEFQCLIEYNGSEMHRLFKILTNKLSTMCNQNTLTETYLCISPLFKNIYIHLPTEWPQMINFADSKLEIDLKTALGISYDNYIELIELIQNFEPETYSYLISIKNPIELFEYITYYNHLKKDNDVINQFLLETDGQFTQKIKRITALLMAGLVRDQISLLQQGTLLLGAEIEGYLKEHLANTAFLYCNSNKEKVKDILQLTSVKKSYFPEGLRPHEIEEKISLWNMAMPENEILNNSLLEKWGKFKIVRNAAAHKLKTEFFMVREYAPYGLEIISKLLEERFKMPNDRQFPII